MSSSYVSILNVVNGIPDHDFFGKAWASEPLTGILKETNIPFALPGPDEDISLLAKIDENIIGQCSTNRVVKYWNHLKIIESSAENLSTQTFIKIHQKAVAVEEEYLNEVDEPLEKSFHSAGIAVIPEYRKQGVSLLLRKNQITLCRKKQATTLFCETTNRFSAANAKATGFTLLKQYSYPDLARELSHPDLCKLNDSFSVWCMKV